MRKPHEIMPRVPVNFIGQSNRLREQIVPAYKHGLFIRVNKMKEINVKSSNRVSFRLVVCGAVLLVGFIAMNSLANMKKKPAELAFQEPSLQVEAQAAEFQEVPVSLNGYGEVKTLNVVSISSEVSGTVLDIHPRLEAGEIISKGDLIFKIDTRDYEAALKETSATVKQLENSILSLQKQYEIDQVRLTSLQRNAELAKKQFERLQTLFEENSVGTQSNVDAAEQSYISVMDQATQMARTVELYPIQIQESRSSLDSARARFGTARANLERCEVRAPFDGRLKSVSIEKGQFVSAGREVVTLADDSVLEIEVSLDSREADQWLRFDGAGNAATAAWFGNLKQVDCKVRWTEATSDTHWKGTLHRVVDFDANTRTLTVAIRILAENTATENPGSLPLVEGMFCSVEIPGRSLNNVVKLPRWAVSYENTVYMSVDGRLKTVPVEVARLDSDHAYVSGGIETGDLVVTTRLVSPLENSLLTIQ
jgi:RND family efflux transporter MFP subunit